MNATQHPRKRLNLTHYDRSRPIKTGRQTSEYSPVCSPAGNSRPPKMAARVAWALAALGVSSAMAGTFTVTNLNDAGAGSLRQAVIDANASPGNDVVVFGAGVAGAITLTTGPISIIQGVTIDGPGAKVISISGNFASRVFTISGVIATIDDVTITNGRSPGGTGSQGGLIYSQGQLSVARCSLSGGVASAVTAAYGGGIYQTGGSLSLDSCTFAMCSAGAGTFAAGGAVAVFNAALTLTNCTFSGNSCTAGTVVNGGGIYTSNCQSDLVNCTVAGNALSAAFPNGAGLHADSQSNARLKNCLFANAAPGNFSVPTPPLQSLGHNLISDTTSGFVNGVNGDICGSVDAGLEPLGDFGGPTLTRALRPDSPAIDAGPGDLDTPQSDQRGFGRADGKCDTRNQPDIGAFEYGAGRGLNLNGIDQFAGVVNSQNFNLADSFTIEAVVRADASYESTGVRRIASTRSGAAAGYALGVTSDGKLIFTTFGRKDYISSGVLLQPGQQRHVAVSFNAAFDASFYVDGQYVETVAGTLPAALSPAPFCMGCNPEFHPQYWDGQIAEVRFWNVVRSHAQIAANYSRTLSGGESGLVGYWRFAEGHGDTSADLAGGDNPAQLLKQPYWMQPTACTCFPCDANCDGSVNQFDIQPFVTAIATHGGCAKCAGDTNGDGTTNTFDIGAFLSCLAP